MQGKQCCPEEAAPLQKEDTNSVLAMGVQLNVHLPFADLVEGSDYRLPASLAPAPVIIPTLT